MIFTDGIEMEVECSVNVTSTSVYPTPAFIKALCCENGNVFNDLVTVYPQHTATKTAITEYDRAWSSDDEMYYDRYVFNRVEGDNVEYSDLVNLQYDQGIMGYEVIDPAQDASITITLLPN